MGKELCIWDKNLIILCHYGLQSNTLWLMVLGLTNKLIFCLSLVSLNFLQGLTLSMLLPQRLNPTPLFMSLPTWSCLRLWTTAPQSSWSWQCERHEEKAWVHWGSSGLREQPGAGARAWAHGLSDSSPTWYHAILAKKNVMAESSSGRNLAPVTILGLCESWIAWEGENKKQTGRAELKDQSQE